MSPFFQRNIPPLFNFLFKEQSCRGFIVIPTFSNPSQDHSFVNHYLKNLGYFLGVIKDSDSKGRCYFNWDKHSDKNIDSNSITNFYNHYLFNLQNFVYTLGQNEVKQIYYKGIVARNIKEIEKQATRSAISQVMARNMSHNIGSHVLSRLVTPEILEKLFNACSESKELFKLYHPLFDEKIAGSALFANLNTYQKTRMDFLADVTFGEPAMENSRLLRAEILKELDDNRLLLENISGTDNFHYEFIVRNCTNCKKECCNEHNIEACINCETCIINEESKNDIQVSMPNDILGYHALFLILENIIRNCAKHSGVAADKNDRLKYI
ncbi:MAG: hypothetical protein IPN09_02165 [Bacteroidetes bacterium]|nr:hypothetical protein [Bacteroidota bacterium]